MEDELLWNLFSDGMPKRYESRLQVQIPFLSQHHLFHFLLDLRSHMMAPKPKRGRGNSKVQASPTFVHLSGLKNIAAKCKKRLSAVDEDFEEDSSRQSSQNTISEAQVLISYGSMAKKPGRSSKRILSEEDCFVDKEDDEFPNILQDIQMSTRRPKSLSFQGSFEIVPTTQAHKDLSESSISGYQGQVTIKGGDVISRCRLFDPSSVPPVPLCRLIPHARVRGLRDDLTVLKNALEHEEYCPEKGTFILSVCTADGTETAVTPEMREGWDDIWRLVDTQFEVEIKGKRHLSFLSNKMFLVWEGNHRTVAWMQLINDKFRDDQRMHIRVVSSIIDPRKVSGLSLLSGLQRMNDLNEHAVIISNLKNTLVNAINICGCDMGQYLKELPPNDARELEARKKQETKGIPTWYPLARDDLAQLLWQVEYQKDLSSRIAELPVVDITKDEEKAKRDVIDAQVKKKFSDRMQKVLNIINPSHGKEWREQLLSLSYDGPDCVVGLEKLNCIAISAVPLEKKLAWLRLLDMSKSIRASLGMPGNNTDFRSWISREVLFEMIEKQAVRVLDELVALAVPTRPLVLPPSPTLSSYFDDVKMEGKTHVFYTLKKTGTSISSKKDSGPSQAQLDAAALRLVYRYLSCLKDQKLLVELPLACTVWKDPNNKESYMYSDVKRKLTAYECDSCPWWIDIPHSHVLSRERDLFNKWESSKVEQVDASGKIKEVGQPRVVRRGNKKEASTSTMKNIIEEDEIVHAAENTEGSKLVASSMLRYVYVYPSNVYPPFPLKTGLYSCGVGDYISMGQEFNKKILNKEYAVIHGFFKELHKADREFTKKGVKCNWAADMVLLDLPSMSIIEGHHTIPKWDTLTEDHVKYGLGIAVASLGDTGWLLVSAPWTGPCVTWVERFSSRQELEVYRRILVQDRSSSQCATIGGLDLMMDCFCLFILRRRGMHPVLRVVESREMFQRHGLDFQRHIIGHYLPREARTQETFMAVDSREGLQRSVGFVGCFVELLCPAGGLCLEMGCGTAPLLRSCILSGRPCYSFDIDQAIVDDVVRSLSQDFHVDNKDQDDEIDDEASDEDEAMGNPFDD